MYQELDWKSKKIEVCGEIIKGYDVEIKLVKLISRQSNHFQTLIGALSILEVRS